MSACSVKVESDDLQVADLGATIRFLHALVLQDGWQLSDAVQFMTTNAARVLQLPNKGQVCILPTTHCKQTFVSTCFGNAHGSDRQAIS